MHELVGRLTLIPEVVRLILVEGKVVGVEVVL